MNYGAGRTTQLATADRIEMRLEDPPPTEVSTKSSHIAARRFSVRFEAGSRIKNTPRGLVPSFGQPIERTQIDEPIVIEGVVPETLIVGVAPTGLVWLPVKGAPSGMEDERAAYTSGEWSAVACRRRHVPVARSFSGYGMPRSNCSGPAREATARTMRNAFPWTSKSCHGEPDNHDCQESGRGADPSRPGDHIRSAQGDRSDHAPACPGCSNRTGP